MKKSMLVLAAVAAAVTFAKAPVAEAGGLRIGFGFGVPFGARVGKADPSILRRAQDANERVQSREREVLSGRKPGVRHEQAAQAREAKRREAVAAAEAKRQARIAAAAKAETGNAKKSKVQVAARPPVAAPAVIASPVSGAAAPLSGDRQIDAAQQAQKAKADDLLKALAKPSTTPATSTAGVKPVARQSGSDASPFDTGAAVAPIAPATVKVVAPATSTTAAKEVTTGECLRFIPGAGVTVKVSCTE
jgi:hypothetical protein